MNHPRLSLSLLVLLASMLSAAAVNLDQIKSQMKARQPQIEALWAEGMIGENNQGYLAPRGDLSDSQQKLVAAENADRKHVYTAIARSTQTTPEQVGQQRAAQISKRAAQGLWLQDAEGVWYRKP